MGMVFIASMFSESWATEAVSRENRMEILEKIQRKRHDEQILSELLPIVHCSFQPSTYEEILVAQLRNTKSSTKQFRLVSDKISDLLVNKVIDCLPTKNIEIETPLTKCPGKALACRVELVSIMRSGDALLESFMRHFPEANVSKFLIQRDERTARPQFKYMKVSPEISSGDAVVITEPMIATGGTLDMVITLLKEKGVKEENIVVASICVAPEGLVLLNEKFPRIKVVMTTMDEKLNERKYIVPGLGDFGDRFFGTSENHLAMTPKES
jgi:uracil phosphoribosyltransferase